VAATERGVSAVYLGDAENTMIAELREEYPRAEIAPATDSFRRWVSEIVQRIEGKQPRMELPLDLQATAFNAAYAGAAADSARGHARTRRSRSPRPTQGCAGCCESLRPNPVSVVVPAIA